ncbi:hypothetical protein K7432_017561 [Basidiobolus ranarum]|uniref:Chitin-binding type-2 domain-containing protein n=1 Tax=Basidiobolus ranarum TaxID=34480 RepID=A0ABR2VK85_9FUNG
MLLFLVTLEPLITVDVTLSGHKATVTKPVATVDHTVNGKTTEVTLEPLTTVDVTLSGHKATVTKPVETVDHTVNGKTTEVTLEPLTTVDVTLSGHKATVTKPVETVEHTVTRYHEINDVHTPGTVVETRVSNVIETNVRTANAPEVTVVSTDTAAATIKKSVGSKTADSVYETHVSNPVCETKYVTVTSTVTATQSEESVEPTNAVKCVEGQYSCLESGVSPTFFICANGRLVRNNCSSGTICKSANNSIICDW